MEAPVRPRDDAVTLPDGGPRLALRRLDGTRAAVPTPTTAADRPFLLVHGLASNARMWDGVAIRLGAAGRQVVAVDLRGHGRSAEPADGYDTATAAADVAALIDLLGWTGARAPVVAGQSWGGNVVLELAARHGGVAAVALVDGGWIRLAERFTTFEDCWRMLAPPDFTGVPAAELTARLRSLAGGWPAEGLAGVLANFTERPDGTVRARLRREHHRGIVYSMWQGDPRSAYPLVDVPAMLLVADGDGPDPAAKRAAVTEALAELPDAQVRWYVGGHHDLHAEQPDRVARDLLELAARVPAVAAVP